MVRLRAARTTSILKAGLDRIDKTLVDVKGKLEDRDETGGTRTGSLQHLQNLLKSTQRDIDAQFHDLENSMESYHLLSEMLPHDIRKELDASEKEVKRAINKLENENLQNRSEAAPVSKNDIKAKFEKLWDIEGRLFSGSLYNLQVQNSMVQLFNLELASAKRHLRTFTYLSYVLYPTGIVMGILGQIAGVKGRSKEQ